MKRWWLMFCVCLGIAMPAWAHVGSKDVFEQVEAGPYKLYVTIRTPTVIPGVATIEVRSSGAAVRSVQVTPMPLTGEGAKHPPSSDALHASTGDPEFFTGSLWIMASGSWQVHFNIDGDGGKVSAAVPVPAMPLSILPMQRSLSATLAVLGVILVIGLCGIAGAAVGQARVARGHAPGKIQQRRAWIASAFTLAITLLIVYGGYKWWNAEATTYASDIYHPLNLRPSLAGNTLILAIDADRPDDRFSFRARSNNDLLPDHGHLMHLYAIRQPEMDAVFHLHPALVSPGKLRMQLPAMPAGDYWLYADVVHANGFPETLTAQLTIPPSMPGGKLESEDASGAPPPLSHGELGNSYKLPDGYTMIWDRPQQINANTAYTFRFRLLDPSGKPANDERPYLGMAGHAAFVKTDGSVFAHTHPEGSAAMQSMMLANGDAAAMAGMHEETVKPVVNFPYGFPSPGRYRIFIQMKHGDTVETGAFDAIVK